MIKLWKIIIKIKMLVNGMYKKDLLCLSYDIMFKWNIYIYWYWIKKLGDIRDEVED